MLTIIKIIYWKIIFGSFKIIPLKKKVFFESFLGKNFSDSPESIYNYLIDNNFNYTYIWSLNKNMEIPGSKVVRRLSIPYLYHLATSEVIIVNSRMPKYYVKRKGQTFVQTWHGTPLKKLVYDIDSIEVPNISGKQYLKEFSREVKNWDYLISPNEYSTQIFRSAFRYEKEILEYGYPRNEQLLNISVDNINKVKEGFNININDKVILYAPTFRDCDFENGYYQDINIDFSKIDLENTTFIVRVHYLIENIKYKYGRNVKVIDLSNYDNINDLFIISDVLITDYSSVFFDYMILNRPIIFYQYDFEKYKDQLRGLYINCDDLPGKIVKDEVNLYKELENITFSNNEEFCEKYKLVCEEKNPTKKLVEKIFR